MITIEDLFKELSYGNLNTLAMSNGGDGTIKEKNHPMLINYINDGLLELFTRFRLSEESVVIEQSEWITNYKLSSEYSYYSSQKDNEHLYILDHEDAVFNDNVVNILAVYNECGDRLPLNDVNSKDSVFTPNPTTVQVPCPVSGKCLTVQYQALHRRLEYDDLSQCVSLNTPVLRSALINYVSGKVYGSIGSEDGVNKVMLYTEMYEKLCNEIKENSFLQTYEAPHILKFKQRGYV